MKKLNLLKNLKGNQFTRTVSKAGRTVSKHSPLILAITGGVGVVATAVFAYKAAPRVNEIVDTLEMERALQERYDELQQIPINRMNEEEVIEMDKLVKAEAWHVDRMKYSKELIGATALPICTAAISVAAIAFSYRILSGRVTALSSVVSVLSLEQARQDARLKKELDADTYSRVTRPTETKEMEVTDKDGNKKVISGEAKIAEKTLNGAFFSDSNEFVKDDLQYNLSWIEEAERRLEQKLSMRGFIMLNQVYDALELERTKEGAIMGWDMSDNFRFGIDHIDTMDNKGDYYTELYIKWPRPRCIYEDVDYEGRYSIYGD